MHYLNSNWLNIETLPLVFYFGSVLLLSILYGVLKFFEKYRRNQQPKQDLSGNKKFNEIITKQQNPTKQKSHFPKWLTNIFRIKFNKINKYYPSKQEERWRISSKNEQNDVNGDQQLVEFQFNNYSSDIIESSMINLSTNYVTPFSHHSFLSLDEGSLTKVIVTKIEQHKNQKNQEIEEFFNRQRMMKDQKDEKTMEAEIELINKDDSDQKNVLEMTKTKTPLNIINNKLNVALNYLENEEDPDPIYDIPSSRSLINLINMTEVNLPTKQHREYNSEITYYHTSSPNLLLLSTIQNDEESIYDTPKSRS